MKKVLLVLLAVLLVIGIGAGIGAGAAWYQSNHIYIQGEPYPLNSMSLDLTDKDLTFSEYEQIKAEMPYCNITWMVPFQGGKYANDTREFTVTELTREDLDLLVTYFPKFTTLNADGCREYDLLAQFQEENPDRKVNYRIDLGGTLLEKDVTELTLQAGEYDYEQMMVNLRHLPQLRSVTLKTPELSTEQVDSLKAAYESIEFHCTAVILGKEYDTGTRELDLSGMTSAQVAETAGKLALLNELTSVELMDASGSSQLTKEDVKLLMESAPNVVFSYSFDFFGQTVSTASEEVIVKNKKIGDANEQEVRLTLDLLTNCKRMVLDSCQLSNEVLAKIRDDYRDRTKVVWRINFSKGSTLTDAEIIRAVYGLKDSNSRDLIYCEDARFVDFGHNGDDGETFLRTCEYVAGMPNLEAIILSSAYITDLTPFQNCKKLKFLELTYCGMITDISPLAGCESLEMVNLSFTGVTDLSPLDKLPIKNLHAQNPSKKRISEEEQARFLELHPDCWTKFEGEFPYGSGWRYEEDGETYLPYYAMLRDVFRLNLAPKIPNHTGWYLEEGQAA